MESFYKAGQGYAETYDPTDDHRTTVVHYHSSAAAAVAAIISFAVAVVVVILSLTSLEHAKIDAETTRLLHNVQTQHTIPVPSNVISSDVETNKTWEGLGG